MNLLELIMKFYNLQLKTTLFDYLRFHFNATSATFIYFIRSSICSRYWWKYYNISGNISQYFSICNCVIFCRYYSHHAQKPNLLLYIYSFSISLTQSFVSSAILFAIDIFKPLLLATARMSSNCGFTPFPFTVVACSPPRELL